MNLINRILPYFISIIMLFIFIIVKFYISILLGKKKREKIIQIAANLGLSFEIIPAEEFIAVTRVVISLNLPFLKNLSSGLRNNLFTVWRLHGCYNSVAVNIHFEEHLNLAGNGSTKFTVIHADFKKTLNHELAIYKEGFITKLLKNVFTGHMIQSGNSELDSICIIKAQTESSAVLLLQNSAVQSALINIFKLYQNGVIVTEKGITLYVKKHIVLDEAEYRSMLDNLSRAITDIRQ